MLRRKSAKLCRDGGDFRGGGGGGGGGGVWEGDELSEPITMLIRSLALLSSGKSQPLRSALIDACE